jgi:hypothetical protein
MGIPGRLEDTISNLGRSLLAPEYLHEWVSKMGRVTCLPLTLA